MKNKISAFLQDESGATAVEYGLMITLIALVISGSVFILGGNLRDLFDGYNDTLENEISNN